MPPAMEPIIEVRNVSKRFIVEAARAADLRERFSQMRRGEVRPPAEFWALRDVDFQIRAGESVGVVGHNGSGKSTLLKLLTGILKPTTGDIKIRGRVGALIEVGAGFHPDLTGRENIYLNGSILGLSRKEVAARYDAIVGFAGLEKFMDTPVKRYSSGMYMRLGFSVAAHTDPDILLIDEVMAVGDQQFQNRCIRYLKDFIKRGGTAVFVSHAMSHVSEICQRCVWLDFGQIRYIGPTQEAIEGYLAVAREREEEEFKRLFPVEWAAREAEIEAARRAAEEEAERLRKIQEADEAEREQQAQFAEEQESRKRDAADRERREREAARRNDPTLTCLLGVTLRDSEGQERTRFHSGEAVHVEIPYRFARPLSNPAFCFEVIRADGLHMFTTSNFDHEQPFRNLPSTGSVAFDIPFLSLNEGVYHIRLRLYSEWRVGQWDDVMVDEIAVAATITVVAGRFAHGCTYLPVRWESVGREERPAAAAAGMLT